MSRLERAKKRFQKAEERRAKIARKMSKHT